MNQERLVPEITEQDMHLLPHNMRALAGVVGLGSLLKLVKHYGGCSALMVPKKANPDHYLWELIGPEAFRALVVQHQGDTIEIAKCEKATRELMYRKLRHEHFVLGDTQDCLARRYHLTVRQIRNICYYTEASEEDRNGSLF